MTVKLDGIPDDLATFREILGAKQNYWAGFVKKWVASEIPNRLILHYRDMQERPETALSKIIELFGETPDPDRVEKTVLEVGIRYAPNQFLL
jgi:hypothetical protein